VESSTDTLGEIAMSMSVSISLSPATVSAGGETTVSVTISNSAGADIKLIELRPTVQSVQRTSLTLSNCTIPVPASGSVVVTYKVQAFESSSISARAYSDDGQTTSGSASVTVS
jgi:uncharacterized membrane protein